MVLVAGDVDVGTGGIGYLADVARHLDAPVVTIAGNHEFYDGTDLPVLIERLHEAADASNGLVTFLEQDEITICGHRVLGATLWTDYDLHGSPRDAMSAAAAQLNEHRKIKFAGRAFARADARDLQVATIGWLRAEVRPGDIVMTHHAPVTDANPPRYRTGDLAPAFASDLTADIMELRPALWISGHTHHDHDIEVGSTRLVSAQRGYVCDETGADAFMPRIIEV